MTDTITLPRSVVEQAISTIVELEYSNSTAVSDKMARDSKAALRAALEQPQGEQEPFTVLVRKRSWFKNTWEAAPCGFPDYGKAWADERINVYTHPQPPRQPLTDEQLNCLWRQTLGEPHAPRKSAFDFARSIEAAHGIGGEA